MKKLRWAVRNKTNLTFVSILAFGEIGTVSVLLNNGRNLRVAIYQGAQSRREYTDVALRNSDTPDAAPAWKISCKGCTAVQFDLQNRTSMYGFLLETEVY